MSLKIINLFAALSDKLILKGINLAMNPGEVHVIMGPNGSGKSTLAGILMGNPAYKIKDQSVRQAQDERSKIKINDKNIIDLRPDERARMGLFLAFQNPVGIPGVSVANLLRTAHSLKTKNKDNKKKKTLHNPVLSVWEFNERLIEKAKKLGIPSEFLKRSLNEEFSGGEKKKLEMLQAIVLQPKYAIFDEIDTGLDIDALQIVACGIEQLKKEGTGILVITHYQRILKFAKPDYVHILVKGKIIESGDYKLAKEVEKNGYKRWTIFKH